MRGAAGTIEEQFALARVAGEGRGVFEIGLAFASELGCRRNLGCGRFASSGAVPPFKKGA